MASMFEKYGGFAKISRIVSAFYEKVLDSTVLAPYFDGVDMRNLIDHQTKFIAQVMGGPASYTDRELERVHARHNITDDAFREMHALLQETLEDFDFAEEDIETVCDQIVARKPFIVAGS